MQRQTAKQSNLIPHQSFQLYSISCLHPCREVVELFRRDELLDWSEFEATFGPVLRDGIEDGPGTAVFQRDATLGERQWEDFRRRVIEHVCSACMCTLY